SRPTALPSSRRTMMMELGARLSSTTGIRSGKGSETIGAFFSDMRFGRGCQFHARHARPVIYPHPGVKHFAGCCLAATGRTGGGEGDIFGKAAGRRLRFAAFYQVEVLLDRAHFSPGEIDGKLGENVTKALVAYADAHGLTKGASLTKELVSSLAADTRPVL